MEGMRILVVDADEETRSETAKFLASAVEGEILTAESVTAATEQLESSPPTVLVTGYDFPDGNGLELVRRLRDLSPSSGCILYTRSESVDTTTFEDVIVDFVPKEAPDATETLRALVAETGFEQTQAAHPVPEHEQERLAAAEQFANWTETAPFERITLLATQHFDLDAAAVTIIHREEVDVLASVGPALTPALREQSLGTHVLTADQRVLGIEDTRIDPRFSDVTAIHEAGIVSYLGARIYDPDGNAVAVLSVYGTEPTIFDAADREYLGTLATLAGDLLASDGGEVE